VAIYYRVSSHKQEEKYGLDAQRRILPDYCMKMDWYHDSELVYDEGGVSGETISERPEMQRLLRDAGNKKFDTVLVIEMERLTRSKDLHDLNTIKKAFRENGIKIATTGQFYDLNDLEDDFLSDLFGALSKREKQKILARAERGRQEKLKQGGHIGCGIPYGYDYDNNSHLFVINKEEAECVDFQEYSQRNDVSGDNTPSK